MPATPDASDEALFAAWRAGDERAFETLFRRYQAPLVRHLTRMLDDPAAAEDLVVETFVRLHRHRERVRPGERLRPLVWTIARNLGRNWIRSQRLWRWVPLQAADATAGSASASGWEPRGGSGSASATTGEVRRRVAEAFAVLPAAQRETASLRLVGGLSLEEIATVTAVPLGTVKSRLFHALRRLRGLLADLHPEKE